MTSIQTPQLHKLGVFLERTGLSRSTALREVANGNLHATRIGRTLRFSEAEICRYIQQAEEASK